LYTFAKTAKLFLYLNRN